MVEEEPLCVRCAQHMRTCCQVREVYVTPGDLRRIRQHTGRDDFYEYRAPSDPDYLDQDDDPVWKECVFNDGGSRRVLARQRGECVFLGSHGCALSLDVRPLVCRLYPFDYDAHGIREELAPGCPLELLRPGQSLTEALVMTVEEAIRWHRQLYEEIRWEKGVPCGAG